MTSENHLDLLIKILINHTKDKALRNDLYDFHRQYLDGEKLKEPTKQDDGHDHSIDVPGAHWCPKCINWPKKHKQPEEKQRFCRKCWDNGLGCSSCDKHDCPSNQAFCVCGEEPETKECECCYDGWITDTTGKKNYVRCECKCHKKPDSPIIKERSIHDICADLNNPVSRSEFYSKSEIDQMIKDFLPPR